MPKLWIFPVKGEAQFNSIAFGSLTVQIKREYMANIELTLLINTQIEENIPRYVLRINGVFFTEKLSFLKEFWEKKKETKINTVSKFKRRRLLLKPASRWYSLNDHCLRSLYPDHLSFPQAHWAYRCLSSF